MEKDTSAMTDTLLGILSDIKHRANQACEVAKQKICKSEMDHNGIKQSLSAVCESIETAEFIVKKVLVDGRGQLTTRDIAEMKNEDKACGATGVRG